MIVAGWTWLDPTKRSSWMETPHPSAGSPHRGNVVRAREGVRERVSPPGPRTSRWPTPWGPATAATSSVGDAQVTEIGCHARGRLPLSATRTILDIGGRNQGDQGPGRRGRDFCMNDKCAAGPGDSAGRGRGDGVLFEEIARSRRPKSRQDHERLHRLRRAELMSQLAAAGRSRRSSAGSHSIPARSVALLRRVEIEEELTFTEGLRNLGMVRASRSGSGSRSTSRPTRSSSGDGGGSLRPRPGGSTGGRAAGDGAAPGRGVVTPARPGAARPGSLRSIRRTAGR